MYSTLDHQQIVSQLLFLKSRSNFSADYNIRQDFDIS